jgi:uncharacterized membrane protein YgcG
MFYLIPIFAIAGIVWFIWYLAKRHEEQQAERITFSKQNRVYTPPRYTSQDPGYVARRRKEQIQRRHDVPDPEVSPSFYNGLALGMSSQGALNDSFESVPSRVDYSPAHFEGGGGSSGGGGASSSWDSPSESSSSSHDSSSSSSSCDSYSSDSGSSFDSGGSCGSSD